VSGRAASTTGGLKRARAVGATLVLLALGASVARAVSTPSARAAPRPVATKPAPAGSLHHGSVTEEPGYYPPSDPESASVRIGRRLNAPLVTKRFTGGATSLVDLGRRVCHALDVNREDSLMTLCVREDEFRDILWREFPQSRPATGVEWTDGWLFLFGRLHGGAVGALRDYGGHHYDFLRWDRYDSTTAYKNFKLHNGLVLFAKDDAGQVQRLTFLRSVVERKGAFKIYSMKD